MADSAIRHTPWGMPQTLKEIRPGITQVSTASHGGLHLSAERLAQFQATFPSFTPFAGFPWFEEDSDVCAVVLAFSGEFSDDEIRAAVRGAISGAKPFDFGKPGEPRIQRYPRWEAIAWWLQNDPSGQAVKHRADAFAEANADKWESGSMGTTKDRGIWWVSMRNVGTGEHRECYMTLDEIYSKRFFTLAEVEQASRFATA